MFGALCNVSSIALQNALMQRKLKAENESLQNYLAAMPIDFPEIVGLSQGIQEVRRQIASAARCPLDILISGESGTGKELVARALHMAGRRANGPFTAVDCGALSENLIEAELFGFRKGAFTGASENKIGLIEACNGGVLFLDEITNLPLRCQAKLLRVLQEREVRRIGDTLARRIDVQVIAASNKLLRRELARGRFREDLYHRLNAVEIYVPPLRERQDDIVILAEMFLDRTIKREGGVRRRLSDGAERVLRSYDYPGNVRELKNIIEGAYYLCSGELIEERDLKIGPSRQEATRATEANIVADLIGRLNDGGKFENTIKDPFLRREFGRNILRQVIQYGLRGGGGTYRAAFRLLNVPDEQYAVMMQFLKRHGCYIDYREFRPLRRKARI